MERFRLATLAVAVLGLVGVGARSLAEGKGESARKTDHLERLAAKLNLNDKQKEEIRTIHADFDTKADPVEHQVWVLHHEEHEAMKKLLTEEQRAKIPEAMKSVVGQEMQKYAGELKLNDEQKQKIGSICERYEPKFHELAAQKEKSEDVHERFRELRQQMVGAIRAELNDEQRDKLPAILREDHRYWRNPEVSLQRYKAIGEKLGVSAQQKEQFRQLSDEYDPKIKPLQAELKKLHQEEYAAIEKVFTEEQRAKWKEMHKGRLGAEKTEEKN